MSQVYLANQKPIDPDALILLLEADISEGEQRYEIFKVVDEVLSARIGQEITKRIATALQKALGDKYRVRYEHDYGMFHLRVWGNGIPFEERAGFCLGYDNAPYIDIERFRDSSQGYVLKYKEVQRLRQLLNERREVLRNAIESWNHNMKELQGIHSWAEKFYGFDLARNFEVR